MLARNTQDFSFFLVGKNFPVTSEKEVLKYFKGIFRHSF